MGDDVFDGERGGRQRDGGGTTARCTAGRRLRAAPSASLASQLSGVRDAGGSGPTTCALGVLPGPFPQTGTRLARCPTPQVPHSLPPWSRAVVAAAGLPLWGPDIDPRYISSGIQIHTGKDVCRRTVRVATPCPRRPPLSRRHSCRPALCTTARRRHASVTSRHPRRRSRHQSMRHRLTRGPQPPAAPAHLHSPLQWWWAACRGRGAV